MNEKKNQRNISEIKEFHIVVLVFSYVFSILLLICPYFLQNPYAIIGNDELLPEFAHKMFIFRGLTFDKMYYVGEFTSPFVISIYKILMFFISIYSIFVLIHKFEFFKSNNKLTKAVQYMVLSFSILIVSIMNFYGGHLNGLYSTGYGNNYRLNYAIEHSLIPVIIAILLIFLDIPYLVVGIKEYKNNKKSSNKVKLDFKGKFKLYINDYHNRIFILLIGVSILAYIIVFIARGGIEYPDPKQVKEYIESIV